MIRHHTNPVGTSWQWKTDDAQTVVRGAIDNHYKMINIFKGVPGVLPNRLAEGEINFDIFISQYCIVLSLRKSYGNSPLCIIISG